jgi:hypothetical protein
MLRSSRDSQQTGFAGVRSLATKLGPISERRFQGGGTVRGTWDSADIPENSNSRYLLRLHPNGLEFFT